MEEEKKGMETKLIKYNEAIIKLVEQYRKLKDEIKNPEVTSTKTDSFEVKKNLKEAEEKLGKVF